MTPHRLAVVACLAMLLVGCGGLGTGTVPDPTPPSGALAAWVDFPADRNPRPIVLLDMPPLYPGFDANNNSKIAAYCGKFQLKFQPSSVAPTQATATWPDGTIAPVAAMSAADAYRVIVAAPQMTSTDCSVAPALAVTAARLGTAGFRTDRGTAQMSAWLFTITGATGDVAYPAIAPSAFWDLSRSKLSGNSGGTVSADGRTLTYGFVGGECDAGYKSAVAESATAVAVAVVAIPKGGVSMACPAVGVLRTINVALASPLGGRVVLDDSGRVESVCPEAIRANC